ncbi:MAG: helix-turn-helix transcriptional regulator [Bacilli bacterium]|nr:helix-turn-helix transcriptional regulator [Candidatus Onthovivens sp.]MDY5058212.1 helix-turn-helix transcriptional regulator [Bacilli bacterium]
MRDKTVLKVARIRKGYTIEQLAPLVKLSKNTMNKYDKGYFRNIKLETLKRLEEVLELNPMDIYNNMEPLEDEE